MVSDDLPPWRRSATAEPPERERDWLDDIIDDPGIDEAAPDEAESEAPGAPWWSLRKKPRAATTDKPTPNPLPQAPPADDKAEPQPAPQHPRPGKTPPTPKGSSRKAVARATHPATADPRRSLIEAWDAVPHRVRRLLANAAAAGLGWSIGLVDFTQDICAWVHAHGPADAQSILWFCVGGGCLILRGHASGRPLPIAWLATVPIASAVLGVLLYAPTT